MKKSLLAVVLATSSFVASAEVTLYGRIAIGVENDQFQNNMTPGAGSVQSYGTYFGIKGTDPVYGQTSVIWQIEQYIDPTTGQAYTNTSGLKELANDEQLKQIASDVISDNTNPLPDVLIVNTASADLTELNKLTTKISGLPMVDNVQMDSDYATKISELITFIKKFGGFLQALFIAVLVLIIYNMIRLQMLTRNDEITVSRLIGASDSFIMRPLIYYAICQTIIGAVVAYIITNAFVKLANQLLVNSSTLFGSSFTIATL